MTLLETLQLYKNEVTVIEDEQRKIHKIERKNSLLRRFIWSIFIVPIITGILAMILLDEPSHNLMSFIGVGLPVIVFIWMTIQASARKVSKKHSEKLIYQSQTKVDSFGVVPSVYHDVYTISSFIYYIQTLRANTLEECIAVFYEDERHQDQMDRLDTLNDRLNYIENETYDTNKRVRTL